MSNPFPLVEMIITNVGRLDNFNDRTVEDILAMRADLFLIISLLFIARSDALRSNRAHRSLHSK